MKRGEAQYKDCAVLYRTNAQARLLEERMIMEGVPYNVVGGTNFYARAEIKDILAYLKTIDNGRDEVAVRRIINVPKRGWAMPRWKNWKTMPKCGILVYMRPWSRRMRS